MLFTIKQNVGPTTQQSLFERRDWSCTQVSANPVTPELVMHTVLLTWLSNTGLCECFNQRRRGKKIRNWGWLCLGYLCASNCSSVLLWIPLCEWMNGSQWAAIMMPPLCTKTLRWLVILLNLAQLIMCLKKRYSFSQIWDQRLRSMRSECQWAK